MIACLRGEVAFKTAEEVVIDVGGVGYEVRYSQASRPRIPEIGGEIFLHIYTDVKEDSITLFGFEEPEEKEMFLILIGVSGVGPKLALNILAGTGVNDLATAIMSADLPRLVKLPGVGKKTAERLCLELKDKVQALAAVLPQQGGAVFHESMDDQLTQDVISALVNLGYQNQLARQALEKVRKNSSPDEYATLSLEDILRQALRAIA